MGTIHKFTPPPKNRKQFEGYRPLQPDHPGRGNKRRGLKLWQKLRPWQQSLVMWVLLIVIAGSIVGARALLTHAR